MHTALRDVLNIVNFREILLNVTSNLLNKALQYWMPYNAAACILIVHYRGSSEYIAIMHLTQYCMHYPNILFIAILHALLLSMHCNFAILHAYALLNNCMRCMHYNSTCITTLHALD